MFRGERVNVSEGRPALHVALRMPRSRSLVVDGVDVVREVHEELERMSAFAQQVRPGRGSGRPGAVRASSTSGSAAATSARRWRTRRCARGRPPEIAFRFVSNVDPVDLARATRGLDPRETLFVVVSKTMPRSRRSRTRGAARAWVDAALGRREALDRHFVGVAADAEAAARARDPARARVPLLGLGRRPDVAVLGGRALDGDRARRRRRSASFSAGSTRWTSTSRPRALGGEPAGDRRACSRSGTGTSSARRRPPSCRTRLRSGSSPPTCSSSRWSRSGSA